MDDYKRYIKENNRKFDEENKPTYSGVIMRFVLAGLLITAGIQTCHTKFSHSEHKGKSTYDKPVRAIPA